MLNQEDLRERDLELLLQEAVNMLEIASPWQNSRTWYSRLFRVKNRAKILGLNLGEDEDLRNLYMSQDLNSEQKKSRLKEIRESKSRRVKERGV